MRSYLVTGGAGFIGSHVIKTLLTRGDKAICVDNFNDYYDPRLKEDRIKIFLRDYKFPVEHLDISDFKAIERVFLNYNFEYICHLAARVGVRASMENPFIYEQTNIKGTLNLLELAKNFKIKNFIFASSSSVYGGNKKIPFNEKDVVDSPISVYAATKKATELMAYAYHHLYGLRCTGLRFFTVYGPWGRPDMAIFKFTKNILAGKPIEIFNFGRHARDFTYIDDIVDGVMAALDKSYPFKIINLGNSKAVSLKYLISLLEKSLGKKTIKNLLDLQPGDMKKTNADITEAKKLLNYSPKIRIKEGIEKFIKWYTEYYAT